jgi:hypothetical protein
MVSEERVSTHVYDSAHKTDLEDFCFKCGQLGYHNNSSLTAMKLDWCIDNGGQVFLTYLDDTLIGLSGCHPLPQIGNDVFRLLFRGVELPEYRNLFGIVSKTHMASLPFYYHVPLGVEWGKKFNATKFVVTTNWSNPDGITSMSKSHRVFQLLEKQGLVSCLEENISLFNTEQSVWNLNLEKYFIARDGFKNRNELR